MRLTGGRQRPQKHCSNLRGPGSITQQPHPPKSRKQTALVHGSTDGIVDNLSANARPRSKALLLMNFVHRKQQTDWVKILGKHTPIKYNNLLILLH